MEIRRRRGDGEAEVGSEGEGERNRLLLARGDIYWITDTRTLVDVEEICKILLLG